MAGYITNGATEGLAPLREDVAHLCRDAYTVEELDPEDLLGGQFVSGALDLDHPDLPDPGAPGSEVGEAAPRAPMIPDHPFHH